MTTSSKLLPLAVRKALASGEAPAVELGVWWIARAIEMLRGSNEVRD